MVLKEFGDWFEGMHSQEALDTMEKIADDKFREFLGFEKSGEIVGLIFEDIDLGSIHYVIIEDGVVVGIAYLYNIRKNFKKASVGIGIGPAYRGKDIALRTIQYLVDTMMPKEYIRLSLEIETINTSSLKAVKKLETLGFVYEGTLRSNYGAEKDSMVYAKVVADS